MFIGMFWKKRMKKCLNNAHSLTFSKKAASKKKKYKFYNCAESKLYF